MRETCVKCHAHTDRCSTCGHACDDHAEPDGGKCCFTSLCGCQSCEPEDHGIDTPDGVLCPDCADDREVA